MAMYHCHVNVFSRGKGLSAVAGAAYRAREKIQEARTGVTPDYSSYQDLAYAQIFLPECAPERLKIRSILWNEVDQVEKASNARTARQIEFSLPKELDIVQNIVLAREIAQTFADEGMIADLTIHDRGKGNPHAHVMLTTRPFDENGNWAEKSRKEYVLDENGDRIKLKSGQWKSYKVDTVDWNKDYKVEQWRERIAGKINEHLQLHGFEQQVDHRSYERQGIERIPTIHLGHYAHRLEQQGIESDRGNINQQIEQANQKIQEIKERVEPLETLAAQERQRPEASTPPIPQDLEKQDAEAQEPSKLEPESTHHSRLLEHYVRVAQSIHGTAKPLQDILTEKGIQDFAGGEKTVETVREPLPQRAQEPETPSPHTRVEESERKRPHDFDTLYPEQKAPPHHTRIEEPDRKPQQDYDALYDAAKQKRKEHRLVRDPERQSRRYQDAYERAEERERKISRREQTTDHRRPETPEPERQPDFQEQYRIAERRHHELERQKRRYSRSRDDPEHEK